VIRTAAEAVGIQGSVGCHGLRKTFGYHAWTSGVNPVLIMDIYNQLHGGISVFRKMTGIGFTWGLSCFDNVSAELKH